MKLAFTLEYDGTSFVGWQIQKNGISIQEKIEKSLYKILKKFTSVDLTDYM